MVEQRRDSGDDAAVLNNIYFVLKSKMHEVKLFDESKQKQLLSGNINSSEYDNSRVKYIF